MITVTKTYLPAIEEFLHVLKPAWDKAWLTNNGQLVQQLENELEKLLQTPTVVVANGTLALQLALKTLEKRGEANF
jgi:dTDP-4-amino-4,6-dideoxygalactose transaminase